MGDDAAGAAVEALPNRARLTLPLFEGKNDWQLTRTFITKVDGYAAVCNLDAAQTAQAVAFAMVQGSTADHWLANLREREPNVAGAWDVLAPRLQERFSPALTASEKATAGDGCRQHKAEDVQAFADRCETTQLMLDREIPNNRKTGQNEAAYNASFAEGKLSLFLRGLREDQGLKSHVNAALGCATFAEYVAAAFKFERHVAKAVKVTIAEVAHEEENGNDSDGGQEVASLKQKQGTTKKYGGKKANGKNGNKGNTGGKWGPTPPPPSRFPAPPRLCWTCQSPDHFSRNCPDNHRGGGNGRPRGGGRPPRAGGNGGGNGNTSAQALDAICQLLRQQHPGRATNDQIINAVEGDYGAEGFW